MSVCRVVTIGRDLEFYGHREIWIFWWLYCAVPASEGQTAALQMSFRIPAVTEMICNITDNGCKRTRACGVQRSGKIRSINQIKEQYIEKKVTSVHHTHVKLSGLLSFH